MFEKSRETIPELNVRQWFIIIEHQQEGPYSLAELKKDPRFNPDTLVWKKGFQEWIKARFIPEIQEIFKDEPESVSLHEKKKVNLNLGQDNQVTLTMNQDPYQLLLWILIILLIFFYAFYQFYYS